MWSFVIPNKETDKTLVQFLVPTILVEKLAGILLWETLVGSKIIREKKTIRKMWET